MVWLKPQAGQAQGEGWRFRYAGQETLVVMEHLVFYSAPKPGIFKYFHLVDIER